MLKHVTAFVRASLILAVCCNACLYAGIYAPAAGQEGSTAISKDDESIVAWADGYTDYNVGSNCSTTWQNPENALGQAEGTSTDIVCLGSGGSITLTFSVPITDGDGVDFVVFENSFNDTFLELAYVEVSSDGVNFYRFYNVSLTASSVSSYGAVDPTDITGYCSKYKQGYGTGFDLSDLAGIDGLDITSISYVRIVDIIGDGSYLDSEGNPIYDPYPSYGSAGVDLDAIGVINQVPEPLTLSLLGLGSVILLRKKR